MEKKILLNNGVKIPTPGFGTFLTPDGATCVEAVKAAIAAGYTHIDTAAVYKNEKSVGEGIKESGIKRENLFVTSKVWNTERGYDKTLKAFSSRKSPQEEKVSKDAAMRQPIYNNFLVLIIISDFR